MAPAQYPIDGKPGKAWKVTSLMGYRIHPVLKTKKHHNGTDIWSPVEPCVIEAPYDAKVIEAKKSTAAGGGFGNYVILLMKINGKYYTTLFAHMKDGSVKVKKGQKIEAGTPLGKMGTTGMSTGKHLHWELRLGKSHVWDANGKNYIEPVAFFKALIAQEKSIATAPAVATEQDPVAPEPVHDDVPEKVTPVTPPAPVKVEAPAKPKAILYTVKSGDSYWAIAEKYLSKFGEGLNVAEYTSKLKKLNGAKALQPGDKVRVK